MWEGSNIYTYKVCHLISASAEIGGNRFCKRLYRLVRVHELVRANMLVEVYRLVGAYRLVRVHELVRELGLVRVELSGVSDVMYKEDELIDCQRVINYYYI